MKFFHAVAIALPLLMLSACAHKASLKTPSQIAAAKQKEEARAAKEAARAGKRADQEAEKKAVEQPSDSQQVTVP